MFWIKYLLFLAGSFICCLVFLFCYPWWPLPDEPDYIGSWRDFNQDNFTVEIDSNKILIQKNGVVFYQQAGHWADHYFYGDPAGVVSTEVVVAQELKNEDLQLYMKCFDPGDASVILCTETARGPYELHPYPTAATPGIVVTYPPPKGLVRVGMLEADLLSLPWVSSGMDIQEAKSNSDLAPHVYRYRSDDPNLPSLRVTVEKGRITELSGGAEETDAAPYVLSAPSAAASRNENGSSTLAGTLLNELHQQ